MLEEVFNWLGETVGSLVSVVLQIVFYPLRNVDLSGVENAVQLIAKYIKAALCILPAGTIATITSIIMLWISTRLIIKTIETIWRLIPVL